MPLPGGGGANGCDLDPEEVTRARRILEVMGRAMAEGKNVATLDDEMVEALHVEEARRVLSRSGELRRDESG